MNPSEIIEFITSKYPRIETMPLNDDTFFFFGSERMFSFATLVTSDAHDPYSDLSRPDTFRFNIGISKQTYQGLFGVTKFPRDYNATIEGYDFTAVDTLMPHPVYGRMYWVCIINPTDETFDKQVKPLIEEAYADATAKEAKKAAKEEERSVNDEG